MSHAEARAFFAGYRDAFNAFDADRITAMYAIPCVYSQNTAPGAFNTLGDLQQNNRKLVEFYRGDGFERCEFALQSVNSFGERDAMVDVAWTIHRHQPRTPVHFHTAYNLRKHDGTWRVWAVTVYQELAAFQGRWPAQQ